ncbi:MAG: two-component sensor histidine kinase, partial [Actinobacteria bacterium]|nr:two-component sensor histidine kinase [Actinomycetota bacterium]
MSGTTPWPDGRWHYRRSLASRVAVITTVALGVSIAVMALTAFVVMRQQLMSSLDQSLLNRAHKATATTTLSEITARGAPAWMLGAADVRIIFISAQGRAMTGDDVPNFTLGQPEYDVATGQRESAVRTIVTREGERFRVATVQHNSGHALILAQPL